MDLMDYVKGYSFVVVNVDLEELKELLGIYYCVYSFEEVKEELIVDWRIDEFIVDYVDFKSLAEADGFVAVNDNEFIHVSRFNEWLSELDNYGNDCLLMYNHYF